jgi:hypothetical protein
MKFEDLVKLYLEKKERLGTNVHQHISEILGEAKELHKRDWQEQPVNL